MSGPGGQDRPVYAALLAGGKGTRFWPASRAGRPKQFLRLLGSKTLLRLTWERFARLLPEGRILVVASPLYAPMVREELPELPESDLVLEPSGRDTAPAAGLAALAALARDPDPVLLLAPTDHFIADEEAFAAAIRAGIAEAEAGSLVVFGVAPDRPATGYGYIEVADSAGGGAPSPVERFREKPGSEEAAAYLGTGRYYWNAGIFAWRARVFLDRLAGANPSLANALSALPEPRAPGAACYDAFRSAWEALPSISIDYALMEKAQGVRVVPLAAGWSDVGGWEALRELLPADAEGNRSAGDVLYLGARGCSVHREVSGRGGRYIALVGAEDLIVVETDDAILICRKGSGETMRSIVGRLRDEGRHDLI